MPYILRDGVGAVTGLSAVAQSETDEFLSATDPEVLAFLSHSGDSEAAQLSLQDTDAEFARVTEDLIRVLVQKQLILFTDLPDIVRQKMLAREQIRACLNQNGPSLLSEDETI